MDPIDDLAQAHIQRDTVLTIGVFDGVHLGHRTLLSQVVERARQAGLASAAITFTNHPHAVLQPDRPTLYISPLHERLELLRDSGLDYVVPLRFTRELSQQDYREFADKLVRHLRMREIIAGPDFAIGHRRQGTAEALQDIGRRRGFTVTSVDARAIDGEVVSSTVVRRRLQAGDMEGAARLLGRPFSLTGAVMAGDQRGRTLGFPTANLGVAPEIALPVDGIYVTVAHAAGRILDSVTSIGVRPTFGALGRTVETFILDFQGDLYGQEMRIELLHRIREELRFSSVDELVAQMNRDVEDARHILASHRGAA